MVVVVDYNFEGSLSGSRAPCPMCNYSLPTSGSIHLKLFLETFTEWLYLTLKGLHLQLEEVPYIYIRGAG